MTTAIEQKRCSRCGTFKATAEFHRNKSTRDGLQSECKPCASMRYQEWRARYPESSAAGRARLSAKFAAANRQDRAWRQTVEPLLREVIALWGEMPLPEGWEDQAEEALRLLDRIRAVLADGAEEATP